MPVTGPRACRRPRHAGRPSRHAPAQAHAPLRWPLAVIWQRESYRSPLLLAQRLHKGLLGGLWEFPGGKLKESDLRACLQREIAEELAIEIDVRDQVAVVQHVYTHFRITLHAFHAVHRGGEPQKIGVADWRWVILDDVAAFPLAVTDQKVLAAVKGGTTR
ncbi:MAG: NUDIX domain-containing protein [Caldilineaceae bacterium]